MGIRIVVYHLSKKWQVLEMLESFDIAILNCLVQKRLVIQTALGKEYLWAHLRCYLNHRFVVSGFVRVENTQLVQGTTSEEICESFHFKLIFV